MKWNERGKKKKKKNQKKKKKVIEISGVKLFLSYLRIPILDIFFHFPFPWKLNVSSYPKGFIFLSLSLSLLSLYDVIDVLSTGINSIDCTHIHTHTHTLSIPLHSSNVSRFGNGGRGQEGVAGGYRDEEPTPVTRINVEKTGGVPGLYNWPPVNYTPRRASYKRKSIRHSSCQPTGVDNN